jgi:hypothetical protein
MHCTRHRVFLAALICAAKYLNDSSPKNKHWQRYGALFSLAEVNLMEKQLLYLLDYDLNVTEEELLIHYAPFIQSNRERRARRSAGVASAVESSSRRSVPREVIRPTPSASATPPALDRSSGHSSSSSSSSTASSSRSSTLDESSMRTLTASLSTAKLATATRPTYVPTSYSASHLLPALPTLSRRTSTSSTASSSSSSSADSLPPPALVLSAEPTLAQQRAISTSRGSAAGPTRPPPAIKPRGSFANLVASAGGWSRLMGGTGATKARDQVRVEGVDDRELAL